MAVKITVVENDGKKTLLESPEDVEAFIEIDESDFVVAFVHKHRVGVKPITWEVTANVLNIRVGAGVEFEKVGELLRGERVEQLEKSADGKWVRHSRGWSASSLMKLVE